MGTAGETCAFVMGVLMFGTMFPFVLFFLGFMIFLCMPLLFFPSIYDSFFRNKVFGPHNKYPSWRTDIEVWGDKKDPETGTSEGKTARDYVIKVDEAKVKEMKARILKARGIAYDETTTVPHKDFWGGNEYFWFYGISPEYVSELSQYWANEYDWRKAEAKLNSIPLKEMIVDGLAVCFHHIVCKDAPPMQGGKHVLLLIHGWPSSPLDFHQVMKNLSDPESKYYTQMDIVCPYNPGIGFSSCAVKEGYDMCAMGRTFFRLLNRLGYDKIVCQAGDAGSCIAQFMPYMDPEPIAGLHLNFFPILPNVGPSMFIDGIVSGFLDGKAEKFWADIKGKMLKIEPKHKLLELGYQHMHATYPETLGQALSDSPVGLMSWIVEKYGKWSDPRIPLEQKFTRDDMLTTVSMYWLTNCITSSMRGVYKENFVCNGIRVLAEPVKSVTYASLFPYEGSHDTPPPDYVLKRHYSNLVKLTRHSEGGHFAAFEKPDLICGDLVDFLSKLKLHGARRVSYR